MRGNDRVADLSVCCGGWQMGQGSCFMGATMGQSWGNREGHLETRAKARSRSRGKMFTCCLMFLIIFYSLPPLPACPSGSVMKSRSRYCYKVCVMEHKIWIFYRIAFLSEWVLSKHIYDTASFNESSAKGRVNKNNNWKFDDRPPILTPPLFSSLGL